MRKEIVSLGVCTLSVVLLCGAQLSAQIKVVDQGWRAAPVTAGPTIVTANRMIVAQSVPVKTRVVASPSLAPPDMVPAPTASTMAAPVVVPSPQVVAAPQIVYMVPTRSTYYAQKRIPIVPIGNSAPVTYGSACSPCQKSYYVPQQRQVVMAPNFGCAPAVPYRVAKPLPSKYYYGKGLYGQPKLYVDNQPVRNALRWLSL